MAVKEAEDDENVDEEDVLPLKDTKKVSQAKKKQTKNKITWVGEPIKVYVQFTIICHSTVQHLILPSFNHST